jgi:hypothetical protein
VTGTGPPTPPPSLPSGWGSSPVGPPPSTPVTHPTTSTIAHPPAPRKRWLIVLIGVLVLIAGIAISGTVLFATNTLPPLRTAYDFTDDLADGDVSGAYANLCARLRGPDGRSDFDEFAAAIRRNLDHFEVNPFGVSRNGDRASVDFTAHYRANGHRFGAPRHTDLALVLAHEDDDWRVCNVRFRG